MELNDANLNKEIDWNGESILPVLFDTHAHLLDEHFDCDRDDIIRSLPEYGIRHYVEAACREEDYANVLLLCEEYPDLIVGALGIHPEHAESFQGSRSIDLLSGSLNKSIRAIGEIGLDYHYEDACPREKQKVCFDAQLELAAEKHLPVLIHDREAHGDCLDILSGYRNRLSGVMHCFSGSYETAKSCLDMGLYIGIGGSSTFKNAKKLLEIIPKLPLDRILLETDCPYMTPEPFRGQRNDPRLARLVLKNLQFLRTEPLSVLSEACYQNACRLFGLLA